MEEKSSVRLHTVALLIYIVWDFGCMSVFCDSVGTDVHSIGNRRAPTILILVRTDTHTRTHSTDTNTLEIQMNFMRMKKGKNPVQKPNHCILIINGFFSCDSSSSLIFRFRFRIIWSRERTMGKFYHSTCRNGTNRLYDRNNNNYSSSQMYGNLKLLRSYLTELFGICCD